VHNDKKYGGAGYRGLGIATISTHISLPKIAIHELGHSLFDLGDESIEGDGTSDNSPNCDVKECSKWKDLIGKDSVDCISNKCKEGKFYVGKVSIMEYLDKNFEEVNERITCCVYKRETLIYPTYCNKFKKLDNYCTKIKNKKYLSNPYEYNFYKNN
jgi:hypothetical protein